MFKKSEVICPVDAKGCFTEEVTDFVGQYVKDADKLINKKLKQEGRMVKDSQVKHNYPFCWRSNTPLIYKAVPTWFIKVEEHREKLLKNNANTYWLVFNCFLVVFSFKYFNCFENKMLLYYDLIMVVTFKFVDKNKTFY